MDSIHCARQKAVKLLDELEQEFRLIVRRRQGLGKPNLLYVKDLYAGLSQSNYWKYENHTSGGLKNKLPGVLKSNGSSSSRSDGAYHGSIGQVCHADQKLLQDRRPGKLYDDFWYAFSCKEWIGIIDMRCHL